MICPMPLPDVTGNGFTQVNVGLYSIDGASHDVTCTAMSNWFGNNPKYSSKTLTVTTSTTWQNVAWDATDFGGASGNAFTLMSVTCLLPPQTAVDVYTGTYYSDIGA